MTTNPWRICEWTDQSNRIVRELAFHEGETQEVLNLPFPPGAVAREPIMELTHLARAKRFHWFRKEPLFFRVGDTFIENINQGDRNCLVVAVDEESGDYLYNYYMPAGRMFYRNRRGLPVNPKRPPVKWRDYFSD